MADAQTKEGQPARHFASFPTLVHGQGAALPVDENGNLLLDLSANSNPVNANAYAQSRDGMPAVYNDGMKPQLSNGQGAALQITAAGAIRAVLGA